LITVEVNDVTKKDSSPVSLIDDKLDALSGAEWFNVLNFQSGYFQVICDINDRERPHLLLKMGFMVNSTGFRTVQLCPVSTFCQSVLLILIAVQTAIVAALDG
jgi:hypothetical protein